MTLLTPTTCPLTTTRLHAIFSSCGRVLTTPEPQFNTCTALAGSGPAFVAVMIDAMADGAVLMGLPRKEAVEIAAQSESPLDPWTLRAQWLMAGDSVDGYRKDDSGDGCASCGVERRCHEYVLYLLPPNLTYSRSLPALLRPSPPFLSLRPSARTAPGGCTIAGLVRMEDGNIRSTLARTIEAATLHAAGLGQEKK